MRPVFHASRSFVTIFPSQNQTTCWPPNSFFQVLLPREALVRSGNQPSSHGSLVWNCGTVSMVLLGTAARNLLGVSREQSSWLQFHLIVQSATPSQLNTSAPFVVILTSLIPSKIGR